MENNRGKVLQLTIGYPPEQVGGTEVYVQGLAEALAQRGWSSFVACFSDDELLKREEVSNGVTVYRVGNSIERRKIVTQFIDVFNQIRPDIIHVHPLRLSVFADLICAAKELRIPVVFTFHSSTTTCARGDLLHMGHEDCDGRMQQVRCSACLMHSRGLLKSAAQFCSLLPVVLWQTAHGFGQRFARGTKVTSLSSLPLSVATLMQEWDICTRNSDRVVAVCDWVRSTTELNGIPAAKIVRSRHGLRIQSSVVNRPNDAPPVFGYLGRCSPEKGIGVLVQALAYIPNSVRFTLEFCSSTLTKAHRAPEEEKSAREIWELARRDSRVRLLTDVSDDQLTSTLASWDALIVPSLWFESGPQSIYEAFAVQTPVIGSRRGGIAELVTHDVTGFLYPPGDPVALASLIRDNASDVTRLRQMRRNIPPQRTVADVADDMESIYRQILESASLQKFNDLQSI